MCIIERPKYVFGLGMNLILINRRLIESMKFAFFISLNNEKFEMSKSPD